MRDDIDLTPGPCEEVVILESRARQYENPIEAKLGQDPLCW